jgi:outer membrane lipoprotein LolB
MSPAYGYSSQCLVGLALALSVLLQGCQSLGSRQGDAQVTVPASAEQFTHWDLDGKFGLKLDGKGQSANFTWRNRGSDYNIHFSGPLGQGAASLSRKNKQVTLNADGQQWRAANAEQLLAERLDWTIPVSEMRYWVRGIASPDSVASRIEYNPDGTVALIEQRGWLISYPRYQELEGLRLPAKIVANRDALKLTIILKRWLAAQQKTND